VPRATRARRRCARDASGCARALAAAARRPSAGSRYRGRGDGDPRRLARRRGRGGGRRAEMSVTETLAARVEALCGGRARIGAPRVLIANSLLVPRWATWDEFRRLEAAGLTMFGQMTAGSWIYIGTQGILQGTYQTFAAAGERHFGSPDLHGKTILTAGLGGMGGAQPLAATMTGAAILCVEVDPARIERRLATRYLDESVDSVDDALARV